MRIDQNRKGGTGSAGEYRWEEVTRVVPLGVSWPLRMLAVAGTLGIAAFLSAPSTTSLPRPAVSTAAQQVRSERCQECHDEIYEGFQQAPHLHTLRRGDTLKLREKLTQGKADLAVGTFGFESRDDGLWFRTAGHPAEQRVDWIFGSGHHALTPISLRQNQDGQTELVQLHATWYPEFGLGLTPGSPTQDGGFPSCGLHHTHKETLSCFGCHTTYLPVQDGKIEWDSMITGIRCTRCHAETETHMASDGETPTGYSWKNLSAREAVERCGECHRRVEEFTQDELKPDSHHLARFAPVGLTLSQCFQVTEQTGQGRMDCVTCHDPHRPAETSPEFYNRICATCHDGATSSFCPDSPTDSNCLPCHMPKTNAVEYLQFTDHWIRIREEKE